MILNINIKNIQHINNFSVEIDASGYGLKCIVGKNGVGKTTLIKCIRNFSRSDTFSKTSPAEIFSKESQIDYDIDGSAYSFSYDEVTNGLEMKKPIPISDRENVDVELPIPHGSRFNFFQSISNANDAIVKAIAFQTYDKPNELIELLNSTYSTNKFDKLIEIEEKGNKYYCLLMGDDGRYIREDYLSSGEFFLISLYRKVKSRKKLIVIDELDISLDAAAQVFLVKKLREYCEKFSVNILFTTHSLALMRTLECDELYYLTNENGNVNVSSVSYNYIKSLLFGFEGWDKYILTEDEVLENYLEYLIKNYCKDTFYRYKIIYVGGGVNVVDLMERNVKSQFLSSPENVICILDGDQKDLKHVTRHRNVYCIPQLSVEKDLYSSYQECDNSIPRLGANEHYLKTGKADKKLFSNLITHQLMSERMIHDFVTRKHQDGINKFIINIQNFLCR